MKVNQKQIKVLMIDDDLKLQKLLSQYFNSYNIELFSALNAEEGLKILDTDNPELIILDVMMPGIDGFDTCREIRKKSNIPIIMLSARGETMDKIIGLELGADDYMSKPFEPRELVTRIQVVLRRSIYSVQRDNFKFKNLEIKIDERDAYIMEKPLNLTSMEYELLLYFAKNPGKKVSRDELLNHLQGFDSESFSRSIDILISRLRSKLGEDARHPNYIKSVHGFGYVFIGEQT